VPFLFGAQTSLKDAGCSLPCFFFLLFFLAVRFRFLRANGLERRVSFTDDGKKRGKKTGQGAAEFLRFGVNASFLWWEMLSAFSLTPKSRLRIPFACALFCSPPVHVYFQRKEFSSVRAPLR
jgi:hypothetical protein